MIGTTVSRYRIVAKLGGGGMGVVYEGEDTELGRKVAIKFLPEETARSAEALERFKREARAASALNHPHICTVYDLGMHDGQPFLVMERMQGKTLKHVLEGKALAIDRVVSLGEQIADALDAAHRAGIVHRDLKPANLFVTDHGEAKILDFGLAKVASSDSDSVVTPDAPTVVEEHLTRTGTTLGTVAYMSPEQARAEPVDARSDLYSLGVVLYEMATGHPPFDAASVPETFSKILSSPPLPPARWNPEIPERLEDLILRCLEKDPDLRFQSASDLRAELRRLARDRSSASRPSARDELTIDGWRAPKKASGWRARAGAAIGLGVALIAIALVALWLSQGRGAQEDAVTPSAAEKRIAVLPFENLGAAEDAYFADGMADEVRGKISSLPGLAVIARASSVDYKGTSKKLAEIAEELDVRYLLTGTVRWQKSGTTSRIRLAPELVEIARGAAPTTRWQETFDAELADVFAVQGKIAGEVARALELALGGDEAERLSERPTSNLAAYDAFLKGRELTHQGVDAENQRKAVAQFEVAVAADPRFGLAWAYLSLGRSLVYANGIPTSELAESAKLAAETALALSPALPEPYWALGSYHRLVERDPVRALEALRRGLALAPDHPDLLRNVGNNEALRGHLDEALTAQRRAAELDPRSASTEHALAITYLFLHRSREARAATERGLALSPGFRDLLGRKIQSYLQEGDLEGARSALASRPAAIDARKLDAWLFGPYQLSWLIPESERDARLAAAEYELPSGRAESLAHARWLQGRTGEARELAEQARVALLEQLEDAPTSVIRRARLAAMLAILGRGDESAREGERALELAPRGLNEWDRSGALQLLAVAQIRLGHAEAAIDRLEELLRGTTTVTPAWLRVDPNFDPLRGNPRFQKLLTRKP